MDAWTMHVWKPKSEDTILKIRHHKEQAGRDRLRSIQALVLEAGQCPQIILKIDIQKTRSQLLCGMNLDSGHKELPKCCKIF